MVAQTDHPYMLEWLAKAAYDGGGFISSLARAALVADEEHYLMVKPLMDIMRKRFPQYEPHPSSQKTTRTRGQRLDKTMKICCRLRNEEVKNFHCPECDTEIGQYLPANTSIVQAVADPDRRENRKYAWLNVGLFITLLLVAFVQPVHRWLHVHLELLLGFLLGTLAQTVPWTDGTLALDEMVLAVSPCKEFRLPDGSVTFVRYGKPPVKKCRWCPASFHETLRFRHQPT